MRLGTFPLTRRVVPRQRAQARTLRKSRLSKLADLSTDRRSMKFYVRHGTDELMFPSFKDFQAMYRLKFVSPDDQVRRENSDRWVRVGDLPELRLTHSRTYGAGLRFAQITWLLLAVAAILVMVQVIVQFKGDTFANPPAKQTAPVSKEAH